MGSPDDGDSSEVPPAETPAEPTAGVCGEGRVCCNVYDDWPSRGKQSCMAASECSDARSEIVHGMNT